MTVDQSEQASITGSNLHNFAIAYLSVLAFTFVFQSLPPVLGLIQVELQLSNAESGLLMGFFALPGIFLTIPGGWLADRYGIRPVSAVSLVLLISGTAFSAIATNFFWLSFGRLLAGIGGMTLIVAAASLVSNSFRGRSLGTAMGFYGTALPLGTVISFSLFGYLSEVFGWRLAIGTPVFLGVTVLGLTLLQPESEESARPPDLRTALLSTLTAIWPLALCWLWFNAATISFLTFSPEVLKASGYGSGQANFLAGLVMWGAFVVSPAIGPLMTNKRRKLSLMLIGSLASLAIYLVIVMTPEALVGLIVILGLVIALLPAPLFALPADLAGPERQGLSYGVISSTLNVGILIGPYLVGLSRDFSGNFNMGFFLMGGFSLLAALSILPLYRNP